MDKITRAMVEKKAQTFAKLMGKKYGELEPGSYWLDFIACYGGYTLVETTKGGGQRNPFGHKRRRAREMYETLDFACEAVRLTQEAAEQAAEEASQAA
jgi:hypothetical protein